ncbi:GPI ethanolamine phosphate transferase 2-like isoform X2 [Athalia rosae]|uniref:GPI ethanolamine phosphate transferase 2-like isoform X2 n=1 Tax=Athalia rosae TaxID=37344 RepID=UPI0020347EB0|nr:GPI ethanolamine phosphate transferase 2-like isoform X2 [Athalia rosae]XP_048511969.1 GPI ethanolamine phosphate transferase 2-like isoform X2 [Athalia rosae]
MINSHATSSSNSRKDESFQSIRYCTLLYAMCVTLFSTLLFLYGFFPLNYQDDGIANMHDVPDHVEHIRVNNQLLYKPVIRKLIIMVIDGLRWDFVAGPIGKSAMPFTRQLIGDNSACLLRTKVGFPTVTMPRIKAITTGSAPTFVDVVLNFGSKKISGDSLLLQAKNHGHKLIFYGDDTWLKLFPDLFYRSDGTTSFFVTDYTEVDNNVTRHIDTELNKKDWSIMVMHYLGLDHIGHTGGPHSSLIKPKLKEMDDIIRKIQAYVAQSNSQNERTLFVVCGDHGMSDSGGHGGNTPQEVLVPLVAIGASCPQESDEPFELAQVDIGSTLAVMLGIPIPASNLGSISIDLLRELSSSERLFSLYYNAKQVFKHFQSLPDHQETRAYKDYADAIKLHSAWLEGNGSTTDTVDQITQSYVDALSAMRDKLTSSMSKYDLRVMIIAMFLLFHTLYIVTNTERDTNLGPVKVLLFVVVNGILWKLLDHILPDDYESALFADNTNSNLLLGLVTVIFIANCCICANLQLSFKLISKHIKNGPTALHLLVLGNVFHALSLNSSSFVEEEHRTWFFFWTTFCILLFYHIARSIVVQSARYYHYSVNAQICVEIFFCLVAHAVLRHLNSTGDMYAHLPDIADWLQQEESKISMTVLLVFALGFLVWLGYTYEEIKYRKCLLMLNTSVAICIYLRHMVIETVLVLPFYPASRGIYEVHVFWLLISIYWSIALLRLGITIITNRRNFLSLLLRFIIEFWVTVTAMLHRPYNVVLLPIQLLFSIVIHRALRGSDSRDIVVHIHYWLGNIFYFYQGNSNNLSTIDVAAGYVGMESYNPYVTGLFLAINTYSAPVLAYLTLIYGVTRNHKKQKSRDNFLDINRKYATYRLLPLAMYTLAVSIQRYHLFVWTVFSPKLLYEAMYCTVMYVLMIGMMAVSVVDDQINQY